jgi:molecular chaperone HscA
MTMSQLNKERVSGMIGCIDFGTAASKFALAKSVDRDAIRDKHVIPLAIGARDDAGLDKTVLLPSVVYLDEERVLFGHQAENAAIRGERRHRHAFRSLKQRLSTHDLADLDEAPLEEDIDPTGKYKARDCLILFLAHLLERARQDAAERKLPWPVRLRIARPAWKARRAEEGENALKEIVKQAFAVVDILGKRLTAPRGLDHESALSALRKAAEAPLPDDDTLFVLDEKKSASVLEASAVAAGSLRRLDAGRRVVVVVDVGGGTTDFGVFITGVKDQAVLSSVKDSDQVLLKAGDHLDMLLRDHVLDRLGLRKDDEAGKGASNRIRLKQREYKEILFRDGQVIIELPDRDVIVTRDEFLGDKHVKAFEEEIRAKFDEVVGIALRCAQYFSQPRKPNTPIEILLTGGGYQLPMIRDLNDNPGVEWDFRPAAPDLVKLSGDLEIAARQMLVAIGGALKDLPKVVAPFSVEPGTQAA